jgi:hypothetical protein
LATSSERHSSRVPSSRTINPIHGGIDGVELRTERLLNVRNRSAADCREPLRTRSKACRWPCARGRSIRIFALMSDRKGRSTTSAFQDPFNDRNRNRPPRPALAPRRPYQTPRPLSCRSSVRCSTSAGRGPDYRRNIPLGCRHGVDPEGGFVEELRRRGDEDSRRSTKGSVSSPNFPTATPRPGQTPECCW